MTIFCNKYAQAELDEAFFDGVQQGFVKLSLSGTGSRCGGERL